MKSILHVEFFYDHIVVTLVWKSSIDSLICFAIYQTRTVSFELSAENWALSVQILRDKPVRYQTVPVIRSRIVCPQLMTVSQDSQSSVRLSVSYTRYEKLLEPISCRLSARNIFGGSSGGIINIIQRFQTHIIRREHFLFLVYIVSPSI